MMNAVPDDLSHARAAFHAWRSQHGRGRIPEHLWTLALQLLGRYSVAEVSRELGLNQSRVRARRAALRSHRSDLPKAKPGAFVELRPAALLPVPTPIGIPDPVRIEIERPDGARLTVTIPSDQSSALESVCTTFLRAPS